MLIYDPSIQFHKDFLYSKLQVALHNAGFREDVSQKVEITQGNVSLGEIWKRDIEKTKCFIQVEFGSTITNPNYYPACVDAIFTYQEKKKVYKKGSYYGRGFTGSGLYTTKQFVLKPEEILFTSQITGFNTDIDDIVKNTLQSARDAWKFVRERGSCNKCGAPLLKSKAGKDYCAAVCWNGVKQ